MKGIDKYKPVLVEMRDRANAIIKLSALNPTLQQLHDEAVKQSLALQEAVLLMDLVQAWASGEGHQPAKRDRLMAFLKREVMP